MFRRSALLAGMLIVLVSATASASTVPINVTSSSFPASTTIVLGDIVQWNNQTLSHHTSTGDSPLSLWHKDLNGSGTTGSLSFGAQAPSRITATSTEPCTDGSTCP